MRASTGTHWALCGVALPLVLAGCGQEPPKCSSDETTAAVRALFIEQLAQGEVLTKAGALDLLVLDHPRAVAYDDKIKKRTCAAELKIAGKLDYPLEYESQLDDAGSHLVSIDKLSWADSAVVTTTLMQSIDGAGSKTPREAANSQSKDPAPHVPMAIEGRWEGELEGKGWMDVTKGPGGLAVELGVASSSGCGGALVGNGILSGNVLVVNRTEADASCTLTVTFNGSTAEIDEGEGCTHYHGAACGFSGALTKRQ